MVQGQPSHPEYKTKEIITVNGLHLYSALFVTSGHPVLYNIPHNHPFILIHTPTAASAMQGASQLIESGQGEVFCSGTPPHSAPGIEPATLRLPAKPALPPELLPPIMDFRRKKADMEALHINGECVERVPVFKLFGTHITENLSWTTNTHHMVQEAQH